MRDEDAEILVPPQVLPILERLVESNTSEDPELHISLTRQALAFLSPTEHLDLWARLKFLSASSKQNLGHYTAAVEDYQSALEAWDAEMHTEDWVEAQREMAYCLLFDPETRKQQVESAIEALERLLHFEQERGLDSWPVTLSALAQAYLDRLLGEPKRNFEIAARHIKGALENIPPEELPAEFADASHTAAAIYRSDLYPLITGATREESFTLALDLLHQAENLCKEHALPYEQALTLRDLAITYADCPTGDLTENAEEAIHSTLRGLQILNATGPHPLQPTFNINLASFYFDRLQGSRSDNVERSIKFASEALESLDPDAFREDWLRALSTLGIAYSERIDGDPKENLQRSIELLTQLLGSSADEAFHDLRIAALSNLGTTYQALANLGDLDCHLDAIKCFHRALDEVDPELEANNWAMLHLNLGVSFQELRNGDARTHLDEAIEAYQKALSVWTLNTEPLDWALAQMNLGEGLALAADGPADTDGAIEAYTLALDVFTPELNPNLCRRASRALGEIYESRHRLTEASAALTNAMKASEHLYRSSLLLHGRFFELRESQNLYHRVVHVLDQLGRLDEAMEVAELSRARYFGSSTDPARVPLEDIEHIAPERARDYRRAAERVRLLDERQLTARPGAVRDLRDEVSRARRDLDQAISDIRQLPDYGDFLRELDFAWISDQIEVGRAILYVSVHRHSAHALALVRTSPSSVQMLSSRCRGDLLSWPGIQEPDDVAECLEFLGRGLFAPLVEDLRSMACTHLVMVPGGEALRWPLHAASMTDHGGLRYLLDDFEISYVPSLRMLTSIRLHQGPNTKARVLVVVNPRPFRNPLQFGPLEAESVASHFRGDQASILIGDQANVERIASQLKRFDHLHIAGHSKFSPEDPLGSSIELSDADLSLREISSLAIPGGFRLIVLSSCQSGMTDIDEAPNEYLGFPAALLAAGAQMVIASQWPVDSIATALLMDKFYQAYTPTIGTASADHSVGYPAHEALRQAQIWLREAVVDDLISELLERNDPAAWSIVTYLGTEPPGSKPFASPYFWAGFFAMGA